jgi:hypothetical protein
VRKDLQLLSYPEVDWVRQVSHPGSGQHVYDVIIVGGGQCGLTTAFGLSKEKVSINKNFGLGTVYRLIAV